MSYLCFLPLSSIHPFPLLTAHTPLHPRVAVIAPINTNVSIEARPVTHQGLDGMRARTAGPARQIADKSYFISELRSKMTEIARETRSLGDEAAKLQRDAQLYAALERRYEERVAEVRVLEGQLADFNLAFDKVRTGAEVADVQHQQQRLRDANDLERRRLDEVFLQRADTEQRARAVEQEIEGVHRRAEQRMASLGDERRAEYARLQRENRQLLEDIHAREQRIAQLDDRAFDAQGELKRDVYANVQRGLKLKRQHAQLEAEQQRLEEETSSALTPDEMRERLMAKVKEDTAFIEQAQARLEACDAQIAAHTDSLREKNEQLRDGAKGSEHAANYEKLVERDKKITDFLAQFPQDKAEALAMKDALQTSVVGLLQHISKGVAVQQTLGGASASAAAPTSAALGDMKDELLFKQGQMQNSEQTLGHLQRELEKRQGELEKINSLDSKISVELQTLNDKVKQMEADLVTFANVDGLAQMATEQKKVRACFVSISDYSYSSSICTISSSYA